ncbi:MAG: hypothetical protein ACI93T_000282 [Porticoccaceae bacterium]|jgi:hypothetical protein
MKNSAHKYVRHAIPLCAIPRAGMFAGVLSMLAVFAIQTPQPAHGQAGYYTQNGGVVWYGAQQQRGQHPAAGYYPAPGYIQHPAHSQPAARGAYYPNGYPAAAYPYGGTTAWAQPGYVAQPYQQNPAYGVPQQPYGYSHQAAPTSGYGQPFVQQQRQQYAQRNAYPAYGYGYPVTGYPSYSTPPAGHPAYGQPPGQYPQQGNPQHGQPQQAQPQQPNQQQNPHAYNQLTPVQQAARQAAINVSPNGVPVLSPAASKFFQNLQGPNRSTYNQNRQNYSFSGQTRPSNQIPNTTRQSGSRFGQTYSNRSTHNQTRANQNGFNSRLRNLTNPGLRGY